jgi:hypothetical protein
MWEGVPQGSVLAPHLFLFVIDDLQDRLPEGVHSSLFANDSALWVHSPRKEDAVELGRTLSGKEQANRKATSLTKGIRVLTALSGSDWGWTSNLLRKVYQTRLLSEATYAGGGWLTWLSASSVDTLDRAQNRNLRIITGQVASTPADALRVEAGFQFFGCV